MLAPSPRRALALLLLVAVSTPLALVVETGMRMWLFPPEFEEIRQFLRPVITPYVWVAPIVAIPMTALGFVLQRRQVRARLARLTPDRRTPAAEDAARFDALLLATSAPQVPGLLATFAFTIGSALAPVVAALAVSTIGVLTMALELRVRRPATAEHRNLHEG